MNIGIIGAGLTGLTASYHLQKKGHAVTIFEKETSPGGLAMGFSNSAWDWPLEKHYHHIFTSDTDIRELATEIGVDFRFSRTNTSSYIDGAILQLDSPTKLLQFSKLSLLERTRMAAVLGYLRYVVRWQDLEAYTAHDWLKKSMGVRPYKALWEPLLVGKFGPYFKEIAMSWFWARIKARTAKLGYPEGGFQAFAEALAHQVIRQKGRIKYGVEVQEIGDAFIRVHDKKEIFDKILVTVPNALFSKLAPTLPQEYHQKLQSFKSIGAVNMVLELDAPFLPKDVYWLNICDEQFPFLAVVEHTNYVENIHYGGSRIVYVGNYLPADHRYFSLSDDELLAEYHPYLEKLSAGYQNHLKAKTVFRVPFAQPIVTTNFSKEVLPFETPLSSVYLANMQSIYPWDRGTNFAVQSGKNCAQYMLTGE